MRCLTLANELRRRGAGIRFVTSAHSGNVIARVESAGYPVVSLRGADVVDRPKSGYAHWLCGTQEEDAAETSSALSGTDVDWLVVDHYALDKLWEGAMRSVAARIMVIDDLANRAHDCDLLLDVGYYGAHGETRYRDRVARSCQQLLGPRYALLQPEYARLRAAAPPRDGIASRAVIFLARATRWIILALWCARSPNRILPKYLLMSS